MVPVDGRVNDLIGKGDEGDDDGRLRRLKSISEIFYNERGITVDRTPVQVNPLYPALEQPLAAQPNCGSGNGPSVLIQYHSPKVTAHLTYNRLYCQHRVFYVDILRTLPTFLAENEPIMWDIVKLQRANVGDWDGAFFFFSKQPSTAFL
jgi:hypothetical protein